MAQSIPRTARPGQWLQGIYQGLEKAPLLISHQLYPFLEISEEPVSTPALPGILGMMRMSQQGFSEC